MKINSAWLLAAGGIILLTTIVLWPVFNLPVWGDDFLAIWRWLAIVGGPHPRPGDTGWSYFLTPYGPQDTFTGWIYHYFGLRGQYYHFFSLLFRLTTAISLMAPVYLLTKNRLSAFMAGLFFGVTIIGFDTTNWVFNLTSYLSLACFNLFLYFDLRSHLEHRWKFFLIGLIWFYLTFTLSPIRMSGLFPFALALELFFWLKTGLKAGPKTLGQHLLGLVIVMIIIRTIGHSAGDPADIFQHFVDGTITIFHDLTLGRFDVLFYPLRIFGSFIYPDILSPAFSAIGKRRQLVSEIILPTIIGYGILIAFLNHYLPLNRRLFAISNTVLAFLSSSLLIVIFTYNQISYSDSTNLFLLLIGLLTFGLILNLIWFFRHQLLAETGLFVGLCWAVFSYIIAWYWYPNLIYPTYYRYLIGAAIGIAILLGVIINLPKTIAAKRLLALASCLLIIGQIIGSRTYLATIQSYHNRTTSDLIWSQMPQFNELGQKLIIVYFEGDNPAQMHDLLTFNFDYRHAVNYQLWDDSVLPLPMDNFNHLQLAVTDGQILRQYGRPIQKLPIDQVYAFRLQNNHLINITSRIRQRLTQAIPPN